MFKPDKNHREEEVETKKLLSTDSCWERKIQFSSVGLGVDINHTPEQAPCSRVGGQARWTPCFVLVLLILFYLLVLVWVGFWNFRENLAEKNMIKIYCMKKLKISIYVSFLKKQSMLDSLQPLYLTPLGSLSCKLC